MVCYKILQGITEFSCLNHQILRNTEAEKNGMLRIDLQPDSIAYIS